MSSLRIVRTACFTAILAVGAVGFTIAPAAAAEKGAIRGRVLDGRTDRPKAGVTVVLTGATKNGGGRIHRTISTDRSGRYRFGNLPVTRERVYALDAKYEGGLFAGGTMALTRGRSVFDTTLRVWPTIDDPGTIIIQHNNLFLTPGEGGLDVLESVKVVNTSNRAYIGRGGSANATRSSLGFALPAGAEEGGVQITSSDLDVPQLTRTDFGFAMTAAVPPGEYLITFAYRVPGAAGSYDLSRTALYPVLTTSIHATQPLEVEGPRLESNGEVEIRGKQYRRWSTTATLDPGDALLVGAVAKADGSPGLTIGVVAAGLLAVGLLAIAFRRRLHSAPSPTAQTGAHPVAETREHVISLIAALDLRHRAGDVPDDEYSRKRTELKNLLADLSTPERTP